MENGLFCLHSAVGFLLLQQGERSLTGVLLEQGTLHCCGVVRCVEEVPSRGLQGLRSLSLFLEVAGAVKERWLRIAREALRTQDREGELSPLLRNGPKKAERKWGGDLVKVLWDVEEEEDLPVMNEMREKMRWCCVLNKEKVTVLVLGKQDALDNLIASSVKRSPLLSPSNPHHEQIMVVFRSLLLTLAYHTNSLSFLPIAFPSNTFTSPSNETTADLMKKASRLLTHVNATRQQHGRTWEYEVQFAKSLVSSVYEALPALLSPEECYTVTACGPAYH